MKSKSSTRTRYITIIYLFILLIGLLFMGTSNSNDTTFISCSQAEKLIKPWNITLKIREINGKGNTVVFGEEINASDDRDSYDIPAPPSPPSLPALSVWFETSFPVPYDKLIKEFRFLSFVDVSWNLSILWIPAPGNTTSTNITLSWDPSQILKNPEKILFLCENNTMLLNMLTASSYSYTTNRTVHRFQIICRTQSSDSFFEQINISFLPVLIGIIVIFIAIIIVMLFFYKKKYDSFENWKEEKISLHMNEKPNINIKQKSYEKSTIKKKSQTKRNPIKKQKR